MNKYKEALNKIRNIVLDESGDGYHTQRYLQDFYSNACGMANSIKSLTANELKAVQQQMNELGWI